MIINLIYHDECEHLDLLPVSALSKEKGTESRNQKCPHRTAYGSQTTHGKFNDSDVFIKKAGMMLIVLLLDSQVMHSFHRQVYLVIQQRQASNEECQYVTTLLVVLDTGSPSQSKIKSVSSIS